MLYMLGQRILDNVDLTPKCLIKVGLSRNINKRMANYRSDNPSAVFISETAGIEYEERKCHCFLAKYGKHYGGEWYEVSNFFYEQCLKYGFRLFPLKSENQNVYMHVIYSPTDLTRERIKRYFFEEINNAE